VALRLPLKKRVTAAQAKQTLQRIRSDRFGTVYVVSALDPTQERDRVQVYPAYICRWIRREPDRSESIADDAREKTCRHK
jgi:hypothetical protein